MKQNQDRRKSQVIWNFTTVGRNSLSVLKETVRVVRMGGDQALYEYVTNGHHLMDKDLSGKETHITHTGITKTPLNLGLVGTEFYMEAFLCHARSWARLVMWGWPRSRWVSLWYCAPQPKTAPCSTRFPRPSRKLFLPAPYFLFSAPYGESGFLASCPIPEQGQLSRRDPPVKREAAFSCSCSKISQKEEIQYCIEHTRQAEQTRKS